MSGVVSKSPVSFLPHFATYYFLYICNMLLIARQCPKWSEDLWYLAFGSPNHALQSRGNVWRKGCLYLPLSLRKWVMSLSLPLPSMENLLAPIFKKAPTTLPFSVSAISCRYKIWSKEASCGLLCLQLSNCGCSFSAHNWLHPQKERLNSENGSL